MYRNKKVLVTGGTGLVGRELVELLVRQGAQVTSVSLDDNNLDPEWGVEYVRSDLRVLDNCMRVCDGKDFVFHVAGIKGSPVITKSKQYIFFTNFILLNSNMIAAMYATDIQWGMYTSTIGTYGQATVFKEDELWNKNPSPNDWFAGWAKRMGEVQIDAYQQQHGKQNISIIKPVNIYGKYDNFNLQTSTLVPSLIKKVAEATESVEIWGDGSTGRDIIHAKDVARAAIFLVDNKITEPLNIGNGKAITIQNLIETLVKVSGKDLTITHDLTKPNGDATRVADITKLRGYGFESTVSLEEGLRDTLNWFIANRSYNGRYDPFLNPDYLSGEPTRKSLPQDDSATVTSYCHGLNTAVGDPLYRGL